MKKILLFLLLFINILSFSEFNDKAQLKLAINKTINQFNETEKNKLFNEMIKKKSVLTVWKWQIKRNKNHLES